MGRYSDTVTGEAEKKPVTPLQFWILELIAEGYTDKAIAAKLKYSANSIGYYNHQIYRRLGCNRTDRSPRILAALMLDRGEVEVSGERIRWTDRDAPTSLPEP